MLKGYKGIQRLHIGQGWESRPYKGEIMILPTDKCNKCRIYLYGYCDRVRALYDAQSPEQLEKARQGIRDCDNGKT